MSRKSEFDLAADQQRRIAEIGRIVTASSDLHTVFSEFAEQANKLIPFDRLAISNIDAEAQTITDAHIAGLQTSEINYAGPYTLEDSVLPVDVYEDHQVYIADADTLASHAATDVATDNAVRIAAGLRSVMFAPIVLQGKLVGSLVFRSKQENPYGDAEADLAAQIASQIAGVISSNQHIALLEQASERNQRLVFEQGRIAEIGRIVGSTLDFDEVLSRFAQQAKQLVPHDRLVISSWSENGKILIDKHVAGIEIEGHEIGREIEVAQDNVWQRLYKEKLPWVVNGDDYLDQKDRNDLEQTRYTTGLRSLMIVPLLWQGKNSGSMAFRSKKPEAFGEHEVELGIDIAAQISGAIASANQYKQLEEQTQERERLALEQSLVAEIGKLTGSTLEFGEVFDSFVDRAKQLIPIDRIVISVNNLDGKSASDAYVYGKELSDVPAGVSYRIDDGFKKMTIAAGILAPDFNALKEMAKSSPSEQDRLDMGYRSLLMAPMIAQGHLVGTLILRSKKLDAYSDRHINFAKQISDQIGSAVAGSNQYKKLQAESAARERLADEQSRIAEIGRIVSSTLDIDKVFSSFAYQASELLSFDRLVISLVDDDGQTFTDALMHGRGVTTGVAGSRHLIEGDVKESVIRNNEVLISTRSSFYSARSERVSEVASRESGLNSVLIAPLAWQGSVVGTLTMRSVESDPFGDHEVQVAQQIAAQIAGAVATSNQYAQLQAESAERERLADEQSRIAEIGRIVSSTLDIDEVFSQFAEQAKFLVPHDRLVISSWAEDGSGLIQQYIDGSDIDGTVPDSVMKIGKDVAWHRLVVEQLPWIARGDEYIVAKDMNEIEQARYKSGFRSAMMIPLLWQSKNSGVLAFRSKDPNSFGEDEVKLANAIAAQISGAVATANQYRQIDEQSSERQRLADEQARIAEIGRIVSSSLDIEDVLAAFVEQARLLVPFDRIVISVVSDDLTEITDILVDGVSAEHDAVTTSHPVFSDSVQADLMVNQRKFVALGDDYKRQALLHPVESSQYHAGLRSLLMVPLIWQGRSFGSLNLRMFDFRRLR